MKKTKAASLENPTPTKEGAAPGAAREFKPPLKPRRGLFYALLGLLGVWVALLLVMYFTTVFPTRNRQPTEIPSAPVEGQTVPRK